MPRRTIKRPNIRGLVGVLGAAGGEGGGVEPIAPEDVPYTDASFDANTQTRFQPSSGFKDFLSGGRGSAQAGALNAQQIIADQQHGINLADEIAAENRDVANRKLLSDYDINTKLKTDALQQTRGQALLGATLANSEALAANPDLTDEELFTENNVGDLAPEYIKKGAVNQLQYGNLLKDKGLIGAPLENEKTIAETARLNTPATTKETKPNIEKLGDNGFIDYDKNVFTDIRDVLDPTTGQPTGQKRITHYDLLSGKPIVEKQQTAPAQPVTNPPITNTSNGSGNSILNMIKGLGQVPRDASGNNVSPQPFEQTAGEFVTIRDPKTGRLELVKKKYMGDDIQGPYQLRDEDLLVR